MPFCRASFLGHILLARENGVNVPIFGFLRQVVSPLQNGHRQAVLHQAVGKSASTYAAADDDYIGRRRHKQQPWFSIRFELFRKLPLRGEPVAPPRQSGEKVADRLQRPRGRQN